MREQTREKYEIRFENKEYLYPLFKTIYKNTITNNLFLNEFLCDFQYAKSLTNIINLLKERHINSNIDEVEYTTYAYIEINYDVVIICDGYSGEECIFPFEEFEEIIMAYYDFLSKPPLAGKYNLD